MQTFLPYASFEQTAQVLDNRRCCKQRVEAWQIYQTLTGQKSGWSNHPAVKMWKGYENALLAYYNAMLAEWSNRGYHNIKLQLAIINGKVVLPPWIGKDEFHVSHKSNLVRKLPEHYKKHFPAVPNDLPYFWPHTC
jgi:hypothetical protein